MRKSVALGSDRWMGLYGAIGFPRDVSRNLIKTVRPRRVIRHRTEWNLSCFLLIDPLIESQFPHSSVEYQNISYTISPLVIFTTFDASKSKFESHEHI